MLQSSVDTITAPTLNCREIYNRHPHNEAAPRAPPKLPWE